MTVTKNGIARIIFGSASLYLVAACSMFTPEAPAPAGPTLTDRIAALEDFASQQSRLNAAQAQANKTLLEKLTEPESDPAPKTGPRPTAPAGYSSAGSRLQGSEPFADSGRSGGGQGGSGDSSLRIPSFSGTAGLHLASFADAANLAPAWETYQRRYPVLQGMEVRIEYITLKDGSPFLRMKAGPFASPAEAAAPCQDILDAGGYCAIQRFVGDPIDTFIITD